MFVALLFAFLALAIFVFLPQVIWSNQVNIDLGKPTPLNRYILNILNFRFKILALITRHRLQYTGTVSNIYVYPLKSVSYISVKSWEIDEIGLKYDRQYMIASWSETTGQYEAITLRNVPRFSLVKITYDLEENYFEFTYPLKKYNDQKFSSFRLPCDVSEEYIKENLLEDKGRQTNLWGVKFPSVNIGKALPQEFLESMEISDKAGTALLYTIQGKLVKTYHPKGLKDMRKSFFQDYFPIHILAERDVDKLNSLMKRIPGNTRLVDPVQFRPNVVLKDVPSSMNADEWYKLKIQTQDDNDCFHDWTAAHKTPRCSIPNVLLDKGTFDKKNTVTKTLRNYRKIDMNTPSVVYFGQYAIQMDSGYKISVGDRLYVTEKRINGYKALE